MGFFFVQSCVWFLLYFSAKFLRLLCQISEWQKKRNDFLIRVDPFFPCHPWSITIPKLIKILIFY